MLCFRAGDWEVDARQVTRPDEATIGDSHPQLYGPPVRAPHYPPRRRRTTSPLLAGFVSLFFRLRHTFSHTQKMCHANNGAPAALQASHGPKSFAAPREAGEASFSCVDGFANGHVLMGVGFARIRLACESMRNAIPQYRCSVPTPHRKRLW